MKEEEWGEATDSFDDVIIVLIHLMTSSLFWFTRCEKESRERKNWRKKERTGKEKGRNEEEKKEREDKDKDRKKINDIVCA